MATVTSIVLDYTDGTFTLRAPGANTPIMTVPPELHDQLQKAVDKLGV